MSDVLTVELTADQRELLLTGLRYVRSSVLLEVVEPTHQVAETRKRQANDIARLVDQLNGARPANTSARV